MPRSVVLDIGGVLELTPPTGWLARWEQDAGLTQGAVNDVLGDVFAAGSVGTITEVEVIAAARARLAVPPAMLDRFWADMWDEYLGTLNLDLYDWFRAPRPARRTGILSNSFVGAREREHERYGFADIVDVLVYSHEVGLAKPDPAVFALTTEHLGVPRGDVVFLDDTPRMVEAARQAGTQSSSRTPARLSPRSKPSSPDAECQRRPDPGPPSGLTQGNTPDQVRATAQWLCVSPGATRNPWPQRQMRTSARLFGFSCRESGARGSSGR